MAPIHWLKASLRARSPSTPHHILDRLHGAGDMQPAQFFSGGALMPPSPPQTCDARPAYYGTRVMSCHGPSPRGNAFNDVDEYSSLLQDQATRQTHLSYHSISNAVYIPRNVTTGSGRQMLAIEDAADTNIIPVEPPFTNAHHHPTANCTAGPCAAPITSSPQPIAAHQSHLHPVASAATYVHDMDMLFNAPYTPSIHTAMPLHRQNTVVMSAFDAAYTPCTPVGQPTIGAHWDPVPGGRPTSAQGFPGRLDAAHLDFPITVASAGEKSQGCAVQIDSTTIAPEPRQFMAGSTLPCVDDASLYWREPQGSDVDGHDPVVDAPRLNAYNPLISPPTEQGCVALLAQPYIVTPDMMKFLHLLNSQMDVWMFRMELLGDQAVGTHAVDHHQLNPFFEDYAGNHAYVESQVSGTRMGEHLGDVRAPSLSTTSQPQLDGGAILASRPDPTDHTDRSLGDDASYICYFNDPHGHPIDDPSASGCQRHLRSCHHLAGLTTGVSTQCLWVQDGSMCGMTITSNNIGRHISTIHLKLRITCDHCKSPFSRADALTRHIEGGTCPALSDVSR